jgi:hypothetical protein
MKRLAFAAVAVFLLAALLVLLAPALVDTPAVRAEIQRRLDEALHGQVTWEALEVALFPPRGELRQARIEIPGRLSAEAAQVNVGLRLWPLLSGQLDIASVAVQRPRIRIMVAGGKSDVPPDAMALYRGVAEPAASALKKFAPEMSLSLDQARVEVGANFVLRDLRARARTDGTGVELDVAAASSRWKRATIQARVEYADLSARGAVALEELAADPDLAPATLRARLRTDGSTALECEFDGRLGTLLPAAKGRLLLPAGKPPQLAAELTGVDVAQGIALARRKGAPLDVLESAEGKVSAKATATLGPPWLLSLDLIKSDAAVKLAQLPWKLSVHAAKVALSRERVLVTEAKGVLGSSSFENAATQIDFGGKPVVSSASGRATLQVEQWLPWLKGKRPLDQIVSASGRVDVVLHRLTLPLDRPAALDFDAVAAPRKLRATLQGLPDPVNVAAGTVRAGPRRVRVEKAQGSVGNSTFAAVNAQIELGKAARVSSASGRATLELAQWFPWLQRKLPLEKIGPVSGGAEVTLNRLALRFDDPAAADYDAVAVPRKVSIAVKALPAAVTVDGGSVRAAAGQVTLENVAAAMLDARALISGKVNLGKPTIELALAEGIAGEGLVRWAMEHRKLPPRLEPKTPLRFAAQRISWVPQGPLEADARFDFEGGPALAVSLAWRPGALELRRLAIKDARSDAALSATLAGERIQASFSGTLHGHSIPAMLRQPPSADSGTAQGELRVTIDRARPQDTVAEGQLRVEALDLSWLAGRKVLIERADVTAEASGVRVAGARFSVEDQAFVLSGEGRRTERGPVIEARLESPGVVLERLLPSRDPAAPPPDDAKLWPLPVSGRIEVRSAFVQGPRHRVEPFEGILLLEPQRARLQVTQARVCGVSFPLEFEARPEDFTVVAHLGMRDEPLEAAMRCLTGGTVEITGNAELRAEVKTNGRTRPELLRNLTGTAQGELRNGRVMRFALLGNILAVRDIASPSEMRKNGFAYRRMTASGRFERGEFLVQEAFFDSKAARLAASGRIDLQGSDSRLTVLIAPLTSVERVVGAIPLLGDVFGGTMVALPVSVSGDIRDPTVVPLGPRAVTDQLLGIFERALKLPGKLVPPQETRP